MSHDGMPHDLTYQFAAIIYCFVTKKCPKITFFLKNSVFVLKNPPCVNIVAWIWRFSVELKQDW